MAEQLIQASQAAEIAGVSIETFKRYESIGALSPVSREGSSFFDLDEVTKLFGVDVKKVDLNEFKTFEELSSSEEFEDVMPDYSEDELPPFEGGSGKKEDSDYTKVEVVKVTNSSGEYVDDRMDVELLRQVTINQHLRDEIEEIKNERDWLRAQLERLEARSERDQMLMMSKLETIRGLTDDNRNKRGFWQRALPWFK